MAIPMPIVQDIRRLDRQGMSRAQIARRLHVDRGTVAKYVFRQVGVSCLVMYFFRV